MKKLILLNFFFVFFGCVWSQNSLLLDVSTQQSQKKKAGMLVLGAWAVGNIAVGTTLVGRRSGEERYFHIMNISWNAVNLSIATYGYLQALHAPGSYDLQSILQEQYEVEKVLLLNTGLDVGYVLGGLYLLERAKNTQKRPELLQGFGKSIILQGSFLFVFDLTNYFLHAHTRAGAWQQLFGNLYFDGTQLGWTLLF